VMGRQKRLW